MLAGRCCAAAVAAVGRSAVLKAPATASTVYATVRPPIDSRLCEDVFRCRAATMFSPMRRSIGQVRCERRHCPPAPFCMPALPPRNPYLRSRELCISTSRQQCLPPVRWLPLQQVDADLLLWRTKAARAAAAARPAALAAAATQQTAIPGHQPVLVMFTGQLGIGQPRALGSSWRDSQPSEARGFLRVS